MQAAKSFIMIHAAYEHGSVIFSNTTDFNRSLHSVQMILAQPSKQNHLYSLRQPRSGSNWSLHSVDAARNRSRLFLKSFDTSSSALPEERLRSDLRWNAAKQHCGEAACAFTLAPMREVLFGKNLTFFSESGGNPQSGSPLSRG